MSTVYRVALEGFFNLSDQTRYVFTFDKGGSDYPTDAEIATYFDGLFSSALMSKISAAWFSSRWILEFPDLTGHWGYLREHSYIKAGTYSLDMMPQQTAAVVVGITDSRRRGKKFIAGIGEGWQSGGVIAGDLVTALDGFGAAWIAGLTSGIGTHLAGVCRHDGTQFRAFTGYRVNQVLGTQRRRKQGVGS